MRISDWSSDVCSSDLQKPMHQASDGQNPMIESMKRIRDAALRQSKRLARRWEEQAWTIRLYSGGGLVILSALACTLLGVRSEGRGVWKECVRKMWYGWLEEQ